MATKTAQREPIRHTQTGDITMDDIRAALNDMVGTPEDNKGARRQAREAAEQWALKIFNEDRGLIIKANRDDELLDMRWKMWGFYDGYIAGATGEIEY